MIKKPFSLSGRYNPPLAFLGMPGTGKSFLGKAIADHWGWGFIDTDHWIEEHTDLSVPEIFKQNGEATFRTLERSAINQIVSNNVNSNLIVATGGGTVAQEGVMEILKKFTTSVYLRSSIQTLVTRLLSGPNAVDRPLYAYFSEEQLYEKLSKTLRERERYYLQADFVIDVDNFSDTEFIHHISHLFTHPDEE